MFSCSYVFFPDTDNVIFSSLNILVNYILLTLSFFKYGILNNNLILFKHIFMYIRSLHILMFINLNTPLQINLSLKNFLLSSFK